MSDANRCPRCGAERPTGAVAPGLPAVRNPVHCPRDDRRDDRPDPAHLPARHGGRRRAAPGAARRRADREAEAPGRYQILGEIARGGMGAVLKGRDPDLGRDLAVKVLLEEHRDRPEMVRRFVEEAQIGGQLQHPGIVPVYELGTFPDRRPFFAMKLVKGRTLADLLESRTAPGDDLAAVPGDLRAGLPDGRLRPRPGGDPPRPEAVERHGRPRSARSR